MKNIYEIEKSMMTLAAQGISPTLDRKQTVNNIIQNIKELDVKSKRISEFESKLNKHNQLILRHEERLSDLITKRTVEIKEEIFRKELNDRLTSALNSHIDKVPSHISKFINICIR